MSSDSQPGQWRQNVAAVILDAADNVLLGTTAGKSPYWHFPQGGVGKGESMQEAVLREVWEEVGIQPADCTILASYGGLRYTYRHKNKKSERWLGQEQTYFLIRCRGVEPVVEPKAQSDEFAALCWVPWRQLMLDMFVPFKREAVGPALEAFFPHGCTNLCDVTQRLSPARYTYDAKQSISQYACADRALFGGGKVEMLAQMEDLTRRINAAQRRSCQGRLAVQLVGLPGCGLTNCLRRLARCMDPLFTHAVQPPHPDAAALPGAGECSLLNVTHYTPAIESPSVAEVMLAHAKRQLEYCAEQGVTVINIFLHVSHAEHCDRADAPLSAQQWQTLIHRADAVLRDAACAAAPWYIVPADCRWYRDFVIARIVAAALEQMP